MSLRSPPLAALRAFVAAGRSLSFKQAASDLGLTPSAISHQIRALEEHLGVALFERTHRTMALTRAGSSYWIVVRDAFAAIEAGAKAVTSGSVNPLRISVAPLFANVVLLPRLAAFSMLNPEIRLAIDTSNLIADFNRDPVDIAIRWGFGTWPDTIALSLIPVTSIPVARAGMVAEGGPEVVLEHTLIHTAMLPRTWSNWLEVHGLVRPPSARDLWLDTLPGALDAAEQGLGIAFAPYPMVEATLRQKRLVSLFPIPPITKQAYFLVYGQNRKIDSRVRAFADWMVDAAEDFKRDVLRSTLAGLAA
jgi:LysR family glycine cleavage system transcriptional activator